MFSYYTKYLVLIFLLTFSITKIKAQSLSVQKLNWLEGVWQCIENPILFEEWINTADGLEGKAYQLVNGIKKENQKVLISEKDNHILYQVTQLKPNKKTEYTLSHSKGKWVFKNENTGFPQYIIYQKLSIKKYKIILTDNMPQSTEIEEMSFTKRSSKSWKIQ